MSDPRHTGEVVFCHRNGGYFFIDPDSDEFDDDVWAHASDLKSPVPLHSLEGKPVEFWNVSNEPDGPAAGAVRVMDG